MTKHTDTSRSGELVEQEAIAWANKVRKASGTSYTAASRNAAAFILQTATALDELRAEVERLKTENERLRLDVEAQEALQVSAYHAGLRAGWNFGVSDDNAGMQAALANTDHIKELRRIREARAALGEKQ